MLYIQKKEIKKRGSNSVGEIKGDMNFKLFYTTIPYFRLKKPKKKKIKEYNKIRIPPLCVVFVTVNIFTLIFVKNSAI